MMAFCFLSVPAFELLLDLDFFGLDLNSIFINLEIDVIFIIKSSLIPDRRRQMKDRQDRHIIIPKILPQKTSSPAEQSKFSQVLLEMNFLVPY